MAEGRKRRKRTYGELCAAAHALDLVGERWALLVARELMLGPKRFTDIRAGVPNASPNVLSQRLRELEEAGIVCRRRLGPPAGTSVYELTEWGRELEPVMLSLGRWGSRSPALQHDGDFSVDSLALAMRALFDQGAAGDLEARYELRIGDDRIAAGVAGGAIETGRGESPGADATLIAADSRVLAAVLLTGRIALDDALGAGELELEGDREAVERLIAALPMPEPVAAAA